jgi:MFS family permease
MSAGSARLSLVFSCLGHGYMHLFTSFYFVIVLALESAWQLPYHELVGLWTLGAALVGIGALPAGWLADRWSSAGMMVVFFVGLGASSIVCGLVDGRLALLAGLAAIGLFSAIYHPVGIAWLVRNAESRGKALGVNGVFGSIGIASAALVAGALIDLYGWRAAFIVPGALCLATGIALWFCLRLGIVTEGERDRQAEPPPSRSDMLRVFAILLFTMLCMGLIFQGTQAALPKVFDIRLRDIAGDGAFGVGAIVAAVYAAGGVMQVIGGHLADRYPLKPVYLGAFLFQVPVLAAVAHFAGLPLIAVAMLTVTLSTVALPAENMLLARYTPQRHHSLAFGVKFVLAFGTAPLALYVVARIQALTGEFVWLFALMAGLALACTLAALLLPGRWRRAAVPVAAPAE